VTFWPLGGTKIPWSRKYVEEADLDADLDLGACVSVWVNGNNREIRRGQRNGLVGFQRDASARKGLPRNRAAARSALGDCMGRRALYPPPADVS